MASRQDAGTPGARRYCKCAAVLLKFSRHLSPISGQLATGYDLQGLDQTGHRAVAPDATVLALGAHQSPDVPSLYP
jgi:hypothetical protein